MSKVHPSHHAQDDGKDFEEAACTTNPASNRHPSKDGQGPLRAPPRPSLEGLLVQRIHHHKDLNRHLASQIKVRHVQCAQQGSQQPFKKGMPPFSRFRSSWVSSANCESSSRRLRRIRQMLGACHRLSCFFECVLLSLSLSLQHDS